MLRDSLATIAERNHLLTPRSPAVFGKPSLAAGIAYVVACTAFFGFPAVATLVYGDPFTLSNESVAYRFFYSDRLLEGEGASVWVLAGFLTTAVQNGVLSAIDALAGVPMNDLRTRVYLFSHATNFIHVFAATAIFALAARCSWLSWSDRALLALVGLGPLYLTQTAGFGYYVNPDYLATNVVLTLAAVFLFQMVWRQPPIRATAARAILLGLFAGTMVANKVTLAPIVVLLFAAHLLKCRENGVGLVPQITALIFAASTGFLTVLLVFYVWNIAAVLDMFDKWVPMLLDPGGQEDFDLSKGRVGFWGAAFWNGLTAYSYGYVIVLWLVCFVYSVATAIKGRLRISTWTILLLNVAAATAWCYFLAKRPAGTTFFEGACALLALTACALTVAHQTQVRAGFLSAAMLACLLVAASTFNVSQNLLSLHQSRTLANELWDVYHNLVAFADGRAIVVVHPDNAAGYRGVPEFLLKGSADVPTWNVGVGGNALLARYAPGITFRHEYGGVPPNAPMPAGPVLYWVDLPWLQPLPERYSVIREAMLNPSNEMKTWTIAYPFAGPRVRIKAYAVRLEDSAG